MKHMTRKSMISFRIIAAAVLGQFCFADQFIEKVTVTKGDCHFFFSAPPEECTVKRADALRPLAAEERAMDTVPRLNMDDFSYVGSLTKFDLFGKNTGLSMVLLFKYRDEREKGVEPSHDKV